MPEVPFSPGRAVGVHGRLLGLLWLVEPELVVGAMLGSTELLYQEHNSMVENAQHLQPTHTWKRGRREEQLWSQLNRAR